MSLAVAIGLLLAGTGLAGYGVWLGLAGARTARWPRVQGMIVRSTLLNPPTGTDADAPPPELAVLYRYEVGGKTYFGQRLRIGGNVALHGEGAWYRKGGPASIAYHPRNPARSVLDPGLDETMVARWVLPGLFLLAFGVLGLL